MAQQAREGSTEHRISADKGNRTLKPGAMPVRM